MCLKSHVPFSDRSFGFGASQTAFLQCVICKTGQSADRMTAGAVTASGEQAAACYAHTYAKPTWLLGWAEFQIEQQSIELLQQSETKPASGIIIERRIGLNASEQAADIARHLQVRQLLGKAIIVTERPSIFLSMVRKQWLKGLRVLQRERIAVFDRALKSELTTQIEAMQLLRFVARGNDSFDGAHVLFVTPEIAKVLLKQGKTIYITTLLQDKDLLSCLAQDGSVVVDYACNV